MSTELIFNSPTPATLAQAQTPPSSPAAKFQSEQLWMFGAGVLGVMVIVLAIQINLQGRKLRKQIRFEEFKSRELKKKLKMSLQTISKMEQNPDLIHSRDFNLDYLRMRMDEELFHFRILNQLKVKVKSKISEALRPNQSFTGMVGIASTSRPVDETFDVEYEPGEDQRGNKGKRRVLFRIQIKLTKLPTQPTSVTISQLIDCIETFLSPTVDHDTWQPTIQGQLARMNWDQKAKPTPLLVLEQLQEGVNVTFKTSKRRQVEAR